MEGFEIMWYILKPIVIGIGITIALAILFVGILVGGLLF